MPLTSGELDGPRYDRGPPEAREDALFGLADALGEFPICPGRGLARLCPLPADQEIQISSEISRPRPHRGQVGGLPSGGPSSSSALPQSGHLTASSREYCSLGLTQPIQASRLRAAGLSNSTTTGHTPGRTAGSTARPRSPRCRSVRPPGRSAPGGHGGDAGPGRPGRIHSDPRSEPSNRSGRTCAGNSLPYSYSRRQMNRRLFGLVVVFPPAVTKGPLLASGDGPEICPDPPEAKEDTFSDLGDTFGQLRIYPIIPLAAGRYCGRCRAGNTARRPRRSPGSPPSPPLGPQAPSIPIPILRA